MVIVKRSLSTRKPISILANVPRDQSIQRGVTLGPRPIRPAKPAKGTVVVGDITIEHFESGVTIHHRDSPETRLRLTLSELDDLLVARDRVLEDNAKAVRPSPPPRLLPPGARPQPYDAATAFRTANRALVKIGS